VVKVPVEAPQVDASDVREAFRAEIAGGLLEVETDQQRIIIRIQEKGAFPSGSATLTSSFEPVVARIGEVLARSHGQIVIAGHTDDVPISTARFRSNWELAAARSVTVVHHLAQVAGIDHSRFLIEGHADTQPLTPNDTAESRAKNRRVEVIIVRGQDIDGGEIDVVPEVETDADDAEPNGADPTAVSAGAVTGDNRSG
jgi:chemotaxis protein MotB